MESYAKANGKLNESCEKAGSFSDSKLEPAKHPFIKLYGGDWKKNPELSLCSLSAHGALLNILFFMNDGDQRGFLIFSGKVWTREQVAKAMPGDYEPALNAIDELLDAGVLKKRDFDGAFYSSRMVKDALKQAAESEIRSQNGKKGGRGKKKKANGKLNESYDKANQKLNESKTKANAKLTPDNDNDIDNDTDNELSLSSEEGGAGGEISIQTQARIVIHYLNDSAGKHFREVDAHMRLIAQRLREPDVNLPGVKLMIDRQVRLWRGTEFEKFLRPETLFNATKFAGYYDTREEPVTKSGIDRKERHEVITDIPEL